MSGITILRLVYIFADLSILLLTIKALAKKTKMGNVVAAVMCSGFAVATFYTFSLFAKTYFYMSLFSSCVFFSIDIMLVLMVRYIMHFTKLSLKKGGGAGAKVGFGLIFLMEAVVLMLNPFVEIAVTYQSYIRDGETLYTFVPKPYFYFHLGLCYFMVLVAVTFLIYKIRITPKMYRGRYLNTLVSFVGVVGVNFLFLVAMDALQLDFSYLFYVLIAMFIYSSTFGFKDRFVLNFRSVTFEQIGMPVLLFDYEENLSDYNTEAEKMFSFLQTDEEDTEVEISLNHFLEQAKIPLKSHYENEVFIYRQGEGENETIYSGRYMCYKENDGKFSAAVIVLHDVTAEQKILETEQRMSRSKSNFLMTTSTWLKRPLQSILENVYELEARNTDPKGQEIVENIGKSTTMSLKLIEELMEYALVESTERTMKEDVVCTADYVDYIREVIKECEKKAAIDLEIDDFMPEKVLTNFEQLTRLSGNFIRLAVEHALQKQVEVLVCYSEEGKNKGMLELEITDNGDGSLFDMMEQMKEMLYGEEDTINSAAIVNGLELYILCRLAKNMGGDVEIRHDDEGNNFIHVFVRVNTELDMIA